ncbi:hypothetical protein BJF90_13385 [Pseudonocardia sp. CNS-004]|nr:hypothetical protein BJF90_13385 [Pseudonocardia sp. CNS-004]
MTGEVGEGDRGVRQIAPRAGENDHPVPRQRDGGKPAQATGQRDDGEIDRAVPHRVDDLLRGRLAKLHHHLRVFATQCTDGPQRDPGQPLQHTHGDLAAQYSPRASTAARTSSMADRALRAAATNASPAVVGTTRRVVRSKSGTSSSRSTARTVAETADCTSRSCLPAAEKPPASQPRRPPATA